MTTPNPYDREDTCRCSAWSEGECACGGYVDRSKVRAWQQGYDAAEAETRALRERLTALADEIGDGVSERTVAEWLADLRAALASPAEDTTPAEQCRYPAVHAAHGRCAGVPDYDAEDAAPAEQQAQGGALATDSVPVYQGWRGYADGSRSGVERWVRAANGDWVSLDSERRTDGDIITEPGASIPAPTVDPAANDSAWVAEEADEHGTIHRCRHCNGVYDWTGHRTDCPVYRAAVARSQAARHPAPVADPSGQPEESR